MSTAENAQLWFEAVVAEDGSIPAAQLHGLSPGTHLRIAPETDEAKPPRKKLKGALVGKINVEAFEEGMAWGEQDRIAAVERSDDDA